jgi:FkbM family methyltransferase
MPPKGVLYVGAGAGRGELMDWLRHARVPNVVLVEGDDARFSQLQQGVKDQSGWVCKKEVVAAADGHRSFYRASLASESGLLPPEAMIGLWPNIETVDSEVRATVTLARVHAQSTPRATWLIVDCLPVLPLIKGDGESAGAWDVIVLRVLLGTNSPVIDGAGEGEVSDELETRGYLHLGTYAGRHPAIAHALWVRDVEASERVHRFKSADLEKKVAEEVARFNQVTAQLNRQIDEIRKDGVETAQATLREYERRLEELRTSSERWISEVSAHKKKIEEITQQKIAAERRVMELTSQIEELNKSNLAKGSASNSERKFSSDAEIDDMLVDIAPFFYGRSLTYVDVGAFVGEVFLKLSSAKEIKIREAHLFEPNPASFVKLKDNVKDVKASSLHCYNIGISSESRTHTFLAANSMTKVIDEIVDDRDVSGAFRVACRPLDDFLEVVTDRHIDILKIDVEGKELDIIAGAKEILRRQAVDFIYIELGLNLHGTQQTYLGDVDRVLQEFGYRIFKIYEQKNEWQKDSPLLRRCNVAYMSAKFADANPLSAVLEIHKLRKEIEVLKQKG